MFAWIFGCAFVWRLSFAYVTTYQDLTDDLPEFKTSIYDIVNFIYGNGPTSESNNDQFNTIRWIIANLILFILPLVMLNLLIAIVNQVYGEVHVDRDQSIVRELLSLIHDFDTALLNVLPERKKKYLISFHEIKDDQQTNLEPKMEAVVSVHQDGRCLAQ